MNQKTRYDLSICTVLVACTTVGSFTVFTPIAQAVNLTAGSSVPLSGTTFAARPELGGIVIEDVLRSIGTGLTLQDRIVRSNIDGTLDFYWRLRNDSNAAITIGDPSDHISARRASFAGFSTDVDFRIDGLGIIPPLTANRSADGSTVEFLFSPFTLAAGESTRFFFVKTNATTYNASGIGSFGPSDDFPTFQPAAVPTPALLPGIIGLGIGIWRKRKSEGVGNRE
ncbi:PTPA-CTERM sorting domain-containing protein [Leptothermofonsia sp. ETS-13]|uniref:PTPA-CTERM sorting domain-containing protein n=1 Tax=Leptothermofonsia sp. ETS-13 TaxID=3035696 RepID=UPI003B9EA7E7